MARSARLAGVLLSLLALVATACSNGDSGAKGSGSTTTSHPDTTLAQAATTVTTVAGTTATTASVTTRPASGATTTSVATIGGPVAVTAGGWRMAISQPTANSTTGAVVGLCYEVTGSVREATVAFELTLLRSGSPTGAAGPFKAGAAIGRGSVRVPLPGVPAGRYDIRIQLVIDGTSVAGAAVTIPSVTVADNGPVATC